MNYDLSRLIEQLSWVGELCWYQELHTDTITCAPIKEVDTKVTAKGKTVSCLLNNGVVAVMHTKGCPDFIGCNKVWGFRTKAECEEYWDM